MTSTPPDAPTGPDRPERPGDHGQGPRARGEEIRDLSRLRRSTTDHHVAGVAGGLARHLDIDPVILRVAFVVLIFFGGAGLLLYGACWLLVPQDDGTAPAVRLDGRTRSIVLMVAAGLSALALVGDSWGVIGFPWPLAIVGAVALVLVTRNRNKATPPPPRPYPHPYGPHPYAQYPYAQYPYAEQHAAPAAPSAPSPASPVSSADLTSEPTPDGATPDAPASAAEAEPAAWATGPYAAPYAGPDTPYVWQHVAPPTPPDPARRGPRLFWPAMALAALGVGVLGLIDAAGAPVPDSAYAALVTAICGVTLLVGAFFGRAGGLIPVGLVAALVMGGTAVGENLTETDVQYRPLTSLEVESSYDMDAGDLVLDLTALEDPEALAGRSIEVDGGVGRMEVIVPDDLRVEVTADVGIGSAEVFEHDDGGLGITTTGATGPSGEALEITADLGIGRVRVHTESQEAGR